MPDQTAARTARIACKDGCGHDCAIVIAPCARHGDWELDVDDWRGRGVARLTTAELAALGRAALGLAGEGDASGAGEVVAAAREVARPCGHCRGTGRNPFTERRCTWCRGNGIATVGGAVALATLRDALAAHDAAESKADAGKEGRRP